MPCLQLWTIENDGININLYFKYHIILIYNIFWELFRYEKCDIYYYVTLDNNDDNSNGFICKGSYISKQ